MKPEIFSSPFSEMKCHDSLFVLTRTISLFIGSRTADEYVRNVQWRQEAANVR